MFNVYAFTGSGRRVEVNMQEIRPGIYALDGKITKLDGEPLILVHPFFSINNRYDFFSVERVGLFRKGYSSNLRDLLKSSKDRNIFIFEIESDMDTTAKKIFSLSGFEGKYFIATVGGKGSARSDPLYSDWSEVNSFLGGFSKSFDLAGGYVGFRPWGDELGGCLGSAYRNFRGGGLTGKFVLPACYSSFYYKPTLFGGKEIDLPGALRHVLTQENNRVLEKPLVKMTQEECNAHISKVLKPWLDVGRLYSK